MKTSSSKAVISLICLVLMLIGLVLKNQGNEILAYSLMVPLGLLFIYGLLSFMFFPNKNQGVIGTLIDEKEGSSIKKIFSFSFVLLLTIVVVIAIWNYVTKTS